MSTEKALVSEQVQDDGLSRQEDDLTLFVSALESEFQRLAQSTQANYKAGMKRFEAWLVTSAGPLMTEVELRAASRSGAIVSLLGAGSIRSNAIVSRYVSALTPNLASGTVALRLAPIKWAISLARKMGLIGWQIFVKGPPVRPYKDVRGHRPEESRSIYVAIKGGAEINLRDRAIVLLLSCMALRRSEITSLRIKDFDSAGGSLKVLGKGQRERRRLTVPAQVVRAIHAYLEHRSEILGPASPLFAAYSRSQPVGRPLTSNALYKRVKTLAKRARVTGRVTPHGFRHCAITQALNALNGDIRRVSSFARHAKIQTTTIYDDERQDLAGGVANVLANLVTGDDVDTLGRE